MDKLNVVKFGIDNMVFTGFDKEVKTVNEYKNHIKFMPITFNSLLDVGAGAGFYSIIACKLRDINKAWAFEPFPFNQIRLIKNIENNNLDELIKAFPTAVGSRDTESTLKWEVGNFNSPTIYHRDVCSELEYSGLTPVLSLETIMNMAKHIDLLKISVNDYERIIIMDSYRDVFDNIDAIDIDITNIDLPYFNEKIVKYIKQLGFIRMHRDGNFRLFWK